MPTADLLAEKIHALTQPQLAEVERFVEALQTSERNQTLVRTAASLSEPAFTAVWDNSEDEAYDAI